MQNKKIGKYNIQGILGKGSFGQVFLGCHDGQKYAIKCIKNDPKKKKQISQLKAQVDILKKIKHPNIVNLVQSFQMQNQLIVVMDYGGYDLSRILQKQKKFTQEKIKSLGKQIASAMFYLQQNKIMHRDLKPQNILFKGNCLKICDFGFAKKLSASAAFFKSLKGTPLYIAPQLLRKQNYTYKADVWSTGIIFYEMVTGKTPFYAYTTYELQPKILNDPVKIPAYVSAQLRQLIDGMLQKRQERRMSWQDVLNHKFFKVEGVKQIQQILINHEEIERNIQVKWIPQQQCNYFKKINQNFAQGKIQLNSLKYNIQYSNRLVRMLGQTCINRKIIPKDIVLNTLRLVLKISMQKGDPKQSVQDLAKNKDLMTAVVVLAEEQTDVEMMTTELQLIGFLLKQNFDGTTIDTDHDQQITLIVSKIIKQRPFLPTTALALKVIGILTSQALGCLNRSQDYFKKIYQQHVVEQIAQCYNNISQNHIVLQCLQKFMHPLFERNGKIPFHMKKLFNQLKMQGAETLLKRRFITEQSLISKKWNRGGDLERYCGILFECVWISSKFRQQFMKGTHWNELLSKKQTRLYYLGCIYFVLKYEGKFLLSNQTIQNQIIQQQSQNKLVNVFLIYFAHYTYSKHNSSKMKSQRIKIFLSKVQEILKLDHQYKVKYTKQLLGYFAQQSQFFDDILIQSLTNTLKQGRDQQLGIGMPIVQQALLQPISQQSLIMLLKIYEKAKQPWPQKITKKLQQYFWQGIRNNFFQKYILINPKGTSQLLRILLNIILLKQSAEDVIFAKSFDEHELSRLFYNQQLQTPQLIYIVTKIVNRIFSKLTNIQHLSLRGIQVLKKYFKTNSEQFKLQIITFCSNIARSNKIQIQYCRQMVENGIISFCASILNEGRQIQQEKTIHMIGSLARHNNQAFNKTVFNSFKQQKIVTLIVRCAAKHRQNKTIFKNTIYAIGNISYYTQEFASEIKIFLSFLAQELNFSDEYLLLNSLSTISNLLRHGSSSIQALLDYGILKKVLNLYPNITTKKQSSHFHTLISKAVKHPQFINEFGKQYLKQYLRRTMNELSSKKLIEENEQKFCFLKKFLVQKS